MTFAEYNALPALRFSRLKKMLKSELAYYTDEYKSTGALTLGTAIHTAVLEPETFAADCIVYPGKVRRGKEWDAYQLANEGKQILTASEHRTCDRIAESVHTHPWASQYFTEGEAEVSIRWKHPLGVECKSRIDWLRDDLVLDLKSARDVTQRGFASAAGSLSYHAQMAFYHDAAKSRDGIDRKVVLLAVEKEPPYDVGCYVLPEEAIAAGRRLYQDLILRVLHCEKTGVWHGVTGAGEEELHLPQWCFDEMDDATLIMADGTII